MGLATTVVAIASTVLSGTAVTAAPDAIGMEVPVDPPAVAWAVCDTATLRGVPPGERGQYSCATYPVPLDYDHLDKGTVGVSMVRRKADDQAHRIGSLFFNPGGPGASGRLMPLAARKIVGAEVVKRFDAIGFDPRGVAKSGSLRCFTTDEQARQVRGNAVDVPYTRAEINAALDSGRQYTAACNANAGALLQHMSTKNVVRDLDRMRRGVGDRQLNFVGFSYGTLIGANYAARFPEQSRAIVIDGNVDPMLRTTNGAQYDRERAQGFEIALDGFLKRCKAVADRCAFSSGDPRKKFDEIQDRLQQGPLILPTGQKITLSDFTGQVSASMYSPTSFGSLATSLQSTYAVVRPHGVRPDAAQDTSAAILFTTASALSLTDVRPDVDVDTSYQGNSSYHGVNCVDKPLPKVPDMYPVIAYSWELESPTFGRMQAFDTVPCASWPVPNPDRYSGPWNGRTPNPVLVFGNYYDPATRYEFSKRMVAELGSARLVSVDAFGHTILGNSACADDAAARYLIDLVVPKAGLVCKPDREPFTGPSPSIGRTG